MLENFDEMQMEWFNNDCAEGLSFEEAAKEAIETAENERIWALGAETPEASEIHQENYCRLMDYAAKLKALKQISEI